MPFETPPTAFQERWPECITPRGVLSLGRFFHWYLLFPSFIPSHIPSSFTQCLFCAKLSRKQAGWRRVGPSCYPWSRVEVSVLWAGQLWSLHLVEPCRHLSRERDLCGGWFEPFSLPEGISLQEFLLPEETTEKVIFQWSLEGVYPQRWAGGEQGWTWVA